MSKMMKELRKTIAKSCQKTVNVSLKEKNTCPSNVLNKHTNFWKRMVHLIQHLCYVFLHCNWILFQDQKQRKHLLWAGEMGKWLSFPKHKSDQIVLNKDEAKYVYSNPNDSSVCPLRALASYLLIFPSILVDGKKLFPGKDQKNHFNTCLHTVTKLNSHLYETKKC